MLVFFYLKKKKEIHPKSLTDAILSLLQTGVLAGSSHGMSGQPDKKTLLDDLKGANAAGLGISWQFFICRLQQEVSKTIHGK